jgi:hypothetical protein
LTSASRSERCAVIELFHLLQCARWYASLWNEPEPAFYVVPDQIGQLLGALSFSVVGSTRLADPNGLIPAICAAVREMDPLLPFTIEDMSVLVASTLTRQKLGMTLMLLFGLMALVLAAVGIYGVIAYASAERRSEVATRMALGGVTVQRVLVTGTGGTCPCVGRRRLRCCNGLRNRTRGLELALRSQAI